MKGIPVPYDEWITSESLPLPAQEIPGVIAAISQESAVLRLARNVPMSTRSASQTVLSSAPDGYWVDESASGGLKQTSGASFEPVELTAAEVAVVLPIKQNDLNDASFDVWGSLRPAIGTAFARRIDNAILSGVDKPSEWDDVEALVPAATAAGNVNAADSTPEAGGIVNDVLETCDGPEEDGFTATGVAASRKLRSQLRRVRDATGQPLGGATTERVADLAVAYAVAGSMQPEGTLAVVGEWSLCLVGVRQDLTFQAFDTGVVSDDTGAIILNLMQQDMVALRCVARFGFNVAVPATLAEDEAGEPYPFGILQSAGSGTGGTGGNGGSGNGNGNG
jgi:HK97 family phage major capsid protein